MISLNPYVSFKDNTKEAMEFYKSVFGGELTMSTFKEFHAAKDSGEEDLIMHSALDNKDGVMFMASDTPQRMEYKSGNNFNMSLTGEAGDEERLRGYFEKLAEGGKITMPLEKAIWGDTFGMCVDKFGVQWLVNISGEQSQN